MKYNNLLSLLLLTLLTVSVAQAQTTDSVDVLDYDVSLDLSQGNAYVGDATLTIRLIAPCSMLSLNLQGIADTVWVDGLPLATAPVSAIPTAAYAVGDTLTVRVRYHGGNYVEDYGFGGLHLDENMSYNLGVAFDEDPHVMGRVIMPCRDNFHDKATYTLRIFSKSGWTAECSGALLSRNVDDNGHELSVWRIDHPVSTYLVGISQANWRRIQTSVNSLYGTYPVTLGFTTQDSVRVGQTFVQLDSVTPMYERCFGPYRWGRIGYIATRRGSMEHVNNIALVRDFMANPTSAHGMTTIPHELAHAWFGNLVTCRTEADMWFNEGGAEFCTEVAREATHGRRAALNLYQEKLENVLRTTHLTDGSYLALSPMPHDVTYGSTTYDKGALVWHSLRGLLGETTFYNALSRLFSDKAFGTVDIDEVRDSLSSYTSVDLTDFFALHILTPGFVDYHVELTATDHPAVSIRRQGVGGQLPEAVSQVPVTFFGTDGTSMKGWFPVNSTGGGTLDVAYDVAFCVLDNDLELSDAATTAFFEINNTGTYSNDVAHVKILVGNALPEGCRIAVEHHWGHPWDIDGMQGLVRPANRYWMVRGTQPLFDGVQGRFHFVREGYSNGKYTHLDDGFISREESLDSLVLLYRANSNEEWQAVSHQRVGNTNEGYLTVENLRTGEYTLAVVDTALLTTRSPLSSLHSPLSTTFFPNPVMQGEALTLDLPSDGIFTMHIFDTQGREIWHKKGCRNGRKVNPRLGSGTYLVRFENNFVSLQSKLIVL